jgi:hypothetical protein
MRRTGRQTAANAGTTRRESAQNNARLWQGVVDNNAEELLWAAEVLAGNRQAGEQWLAEAMALAEEAQYVAPEWMLSWIKRLLVHVALKQTSGEIRQLIPLGEARSATPPARIGAGALDRQQLRFFSALRITGSFDVLERACFILYGYLEYPMLDCVLLLGCPRGWIEAMCQRVLTKVTGICQLNQDDMPEITFLISPGVTECAG